MRTISILQGISAEEMNKYEFRAKVKDEIQKLKKQEIDEDIKKLRPGVRD